ncbi:28866_t:CDS:1, partial [Dentiscutata erythropus]
LLLGYLKVFPHGDFIETLDEKNYFDIEINKLDDIEDKQNLQYLRKKIVEIYNDEDKDHYFINRDNEYYRKLYISCVKFDDIQQFLQQTIKKNTLYRTIREIFQDEQIFNKYNKF